MTADVSRVRLLLVSLTGWINRYQQHVIEYLVEENRVLREQLKGHRLRLIEVFQFALDSAIAPRRVLRRHPLNEPRDLLHRPRTPGSLPRVAPFSAIRRRCQRRIVSGVTIVATRLNSGRPSRCPLSARRRRSSSFIGWLEIRSR